VIMSATPEPVPATPRVEPTATTVAERLAAKTAIRAKAIDALVAAAESLGRRNERSFWAMVYDFEHAPMTTNRRQLAELGIEAPTADMLAVLTDAEVAASLRAIVDGLAMVRVYLMHTDHMDDRTLLGRLVSEVLDEEVRDAFGADCQEWIDMLSNDFEVADAIRAEFYSDSPTAPVSPRSARRDATLPRPASPREEDTRGGTGGGTGTETAGGS
jgi:hypothetical protein